ncbi:MAG: hybrid sensor histidine kinase/response regulator [Acidobacteriaceae bacterium]
MNQSVDGGLSGGAGNGGASGATSQFPLIQESLADADNTKVTPYGVQKSMEFDEEIREFLIESNENLNALDQQIVELEKSPTDEELIAGVFRTIHTIKGTSGFFGFNILGSVTHIAESILGQVREKDRLLTPALVSLILETVDAVKQILLTIEANNEEGEDCYQSLRERLNEAFQSCGDAEIQLSGDGMVDPNSCRDSLNVQEESTDNSFRKMPAAQSSPSAVEEIRDVTDRRSPVGLDGRLWASGKSSEGSVAHEVVFARTQIAAEQGGEKVAGARPEESTAGSTIRVDVTLLDKLMNLVGELVLARNQILQGAQQSSASNATAQRLNLITSELQESVMLTRMQPIGVVWNKLPRVVRDLSVEMGKKIEIQMEGASTELDKTIIEAIKDPLTHIVRNACDHGVETPEIRLAKGKSAHGTIWLRAFHEGGHVNIEMSDDGAGIDPERVKSKAVQKGLIRPEEAAAMHEWDALRLIFLPGFSTTEKITSISGRGVGMDVVKTNIEKISGTVDVANRSGMGTTLKIKIPLTLAIIPGLIVTVRSDGSNRTGATYVHRFVIPQANLVELVRLEGEKARKQIEHIHGAEVYRRRGKLLPLVYLSEILGLVPSDDTSPRHRDTDQDQVTNIVVVQAEETAFGLVVDEVNDTQEIVVKALGKQLKSVSSYLGATIMGDGKIALILDVTGLANLAKVLAHKQQSVLGDSRLTDGKRDGSQTLLLFRSGVFKRLVLPLSLVARLEEIPISRTEIAGGRRAMHYRDSIMPLVSLSKLMDAAVDDGFSDNQMLQVIVFQEHGRYVGIVVDEILDIVRETITIKSPGTTFGLLGSGVVGGKVTDFVDLEVLLKKALGAVAGSEDTGHCRTLRILLVDPARIARGAMRSYLEIRGHHVSEASGLADALQKALAERSEVVLTALELGQSLGCELLDAIRGRRELDAVTVAALHEGEQSGRGASPEGRHFDEVLQRDDRRSILRYLEMIDVRSLIEGVPEPMTLVSS